MSIQWSITWLNQTDSTNSELARLPDKKEGSVIAAFTQSGGYGRQSREWFSEQGGLYFSFIICPPKTVNILSLLAGVAFKEAFDNKNIFLKWPNDLIMNNHKLGGILVESSYQGNNPVYYIIGCGINLNQEKFPPHLQHATSLFLETNKKYDLKEMLVNCLKCFNYRYEQYLQKGADEILNIYKVYSNTLNRKVVVSTPQGEFEGLAKNLTKDGFLILDTTKLSHSIDLKYSNYAEQDTKANSIDKEVKVITMGEILKLTAD